MPDGRREAELRERGYRHVAGVDEAGRGPLAGPVVVAAVILPARWPPGVPLDDSKRLAPERREAVFAAVRSNAVCWKVRVVPPAVIDRLNVLRATLEGMSAAVAALRPQPDYVLVDGNQRPPLALPCETMVQGDGRCRSIAAASVVAKVIRDRLMAVYGTRYPEWGFARHKGYATAAHVAALQAHGPSPIHRLSFRSRGGAWQGGQTSDRPENALLPGIWSD